MNSNWVHLLLLVKELVLPSDGMLVTLISMVWRMVGRMAVEIVLDIV